MWRIFQQAQVVSLLIILFGSVALGQELVQTIQQPFEVDKSQPLALTVGSLRVTRLQISTDTAPVAAALLPPHGGQGRFSWLRYGVRVENASDSRFKMQVEIRLLDKNGAVIDEFSFKGRIGKSRYRMLDLRRLTLNYIIPLVDKVEVTARQL